MPIKSERIAIDQLTQAAFSGVLRALEERELNAREFPGPILVGIIAWPELSAKAGQIDVPVQR